MSELRALRGGIHVLHHKEIELLQHLANALLLDPGVSGIGGDHPEALMRPSSMPCTIWSYARLGF